MAIFSNTLAQLIEKTLKLTFPSEDWKDGTATGGSTSTVEDTARRETDDYFQNTEPVSEIYIIDTTDDAAPIGEVRKITDWVQSTGIATVSPVYTAAVGALDTYAILREVSWDEAKEAINMAIDMIAEEALVWTVDETTITLVAATYEYSLPTSMMWLYRVTMADSAGSFGSQPPMPPSQYHIVHTSTPQLRLDVFPEEQKYARHYYGTYWADSEIVATRKLRLEGLASPAALTSDTSTCAISPAYIAYQSGALLHMKRSRRAGNDPDDHYVKAKLYQERADIERARIVPVQLPMNSKRVRE